MREMALDDVLYIAGALTVRYRGHHYYDDLLQEARLAGWEAWRRREKAFSVEAFRGYVFLTIKRRLRRYIQNHMHVVRLPNHRQDRGERLEGALSLDLTRGRDRGHTLYDRLKVVDRIEERVEARRALRKLRPKHRDVVLSELAGETCEETAARIGKSRALIGLRRGEAAEALARIGRGDRRSRGTEREA